jgi:hypothetical protein
MLGDKSRTSDEADISMQTVQTEDSAITDSVNVLETLFG